jgi:FkbM family methyltransferase
MLINFNYLVQKYGKPKGIIHVGAHLLEERRDYLSEGLNNIIWIEANSEIVEQHQIKQTLLKTESLYSYAITDTSDQELTLFCTNNGESSSILQLEKHKNHHPHIHVVKQIKVKTKRIDDLIQENNISINNYNFMNIDIQGAELKALISCGHYLNNIDYLYLEVNRDYLYANCSLIHEIDDYVSSFGFKRIETKWTQFDWGDAFYQKRN